MSPSDIFSNWFSQRGWTVFPFQEEAWGKYAQGYSGIVNAPTGSGKTYSLLVPVFRAMLEEGHKKGLYAIWITPIRALSKEIEISANRLIDELGLPYRVGIRTGDTNSKERRAQISDMPEILITTPESIHILFAQKGYEKLFKKLTTVVVDEWHELIGSKRGVQTELLISRFRGINPDLRVWGISATIGNMEEAMDVLLGAQFDGRSVMVKANIRKQIEVKTILPDDIEGLPWAGHLGIRLLKKVIPVIRNSKSTLIFTNTRAQAEIWYQRLLDEAPELAGLMAMHHGSISKELRFWVEDALHEGKLKAVVCTSSLDLGVDFRPVESIVQIGGPKGVARFMQRAGRSGHQPGAKSVIHFVPTHALEIIEAAALKQGVEDNCVEDRMPYIRSFDVLIQYLCTLAVSDGFRPNDILPEILSTFSYHSMSDEEWNWVLRFITTGGESLEAYEDYHRVKIMDGLYRIIDRRMATKQRLSIGTIVSDNMMRIKFVSGGLIGHVEEWFVSRLSPGDVFWFAGRSLELVRIKDMDVQVKRSKKNTGQVPSWQGGRMPLSSQMSSILRDKINSFVLGDVDTAEMKKVEPLLQLQSERSHVPSSDEFLIEQLDSDDGHHIFFFPFEGRLVHEGLASLLAWRIASIKPISFSIALNDYGFELLSDQKIDLEEFISQELFTTKNLLQDIQASVNSTEMAGRRFRDIASISGLIFKGFPGKYVRDRHLQNSSHLLFEVFSNYDSENILLRQAYDEVQDFQLEFARLRKAMVRINEQKLILTRPDKPTPFAFPIMVDRLREKMSTEKLEDRIKKMSLA